MIKLGPYIFNCKAPDQEKLIQMRNHILGKMEDIGFTSIEGIMLSCDLLAISTYQAMTEDKNFTPEHTAKIVAEVIDDLVTMVKSNPALPENAGKRH